MVNVTFAPTTQVRDYEVTDGKVYEVHVDGSFWGWVAGENRSFLAMSQTQHAWAGGTKRTRAQAVAAARAVEAETLAKEVQPLDAQPIPTSVFTVRLTAENLAEALVHLTGCLLEGAEDLGEVANVRLTRDGFNNAVVVGSNGRDILGLPSTVTAYKV